MKTEQMKRSLMLLLAAFIWGAAFVAQSVGMEYVGPFTFNGVRLLIGAITLLVFLPVIDRMSGEAPEVRRQRLRTQRKTLIKGGILCGLCLGTASSFQQIGLIYTSAGKAGFISALYIVMVPVLGMLWGRKPSALIAVSVATAVAGMYLLCMKGDGLAIGLGEVMLLACALVFGMHIWVIDYFTVRVDGVRLSMLQFLVAAILCFIAMAFTEQPALSGLISAWLPLMYAGVLSCGVAYTLQIIGQKNMNPALASLILSLESVFAALTGWLILGEALSPKELTGCALMFCAILLAQFPDGTVGRLKAYISRTHKRKETRHG